MVIKVEFAKSAENTSDVSTKNVSVDLLFEYHVKQLVADKEDTIKDHTAPDRKGVGGISNAVNHTGD